MIAELNEPIQTLRGNLTKEHYARMQYGKVVIQRRPKRDKPPTEAQKRAREAFAKNTQASTSLSHYHSVTTSRG